MPTGDAAALRNYPANLRTAGSEATTIHEPGGLRRRLRVYVITPEGGDHLGVARAACAGGSGTVQLRAPELPPVDRRELARSVVAVCRDAGALSIVNDDVDLAREVGADGVHLGQADRDRWGRDWHEVRARAGGLALGVSVDDPEQAREAADAGADYLGVTLHPTATKHDARPVGLDVLRAVAGATDLPVVAVGGLDARNAAGALAAGADGIAVISAVAGSDDPVAATRALVAAVG